MMISNVLGEFASITGVLERDEMTSPNPKFGPPSTRIPSTPGASTRCAPEERGFFHVEKHAALTFNSTVISKNADGELKVSGDLTIRGVTET